MLRGDKEAEMRCGAARQLGIKGANSHRTRKALNIAKSEVEKQATGDPLSDLE
jgi:hypothetical protein